MALIRGTILRYASVQTILASKANERKVYVTLD